MSPDRTPFIAGNWKMYKTIAEAEEFISGLLPKVSSIDGVDVAICVPFLALQAMVDSARGSRVEVYAQTMHDADEGAFTGEVSPRMLAEIDVDGVVLGHSERREHFGETDRALALKVAAALAADLRPILCVGETEDERERGDTERKLRHQVQEGLEKVPLERLSEVVVAYEPIWAIGSGRSATADQAQEAVAFVRALVEGFDKEAGQAVRILYGGSLKPENAEELLALPDVDGALAGGASLDPASFARIIEIAAELPGPVSTVPSVCLVILDGWGLAPEGPGNAVALADTPVFDTLWERYDHTTLTACGESVGLPPGQMGNSEVGHLNLGAGAIVPQDLLRIDKAAEDGSLAENEVILAALRDAQRVHLIGLVSDGGVHSSDRHLKALIDIAAQEGVEDLVIHAFTDGRDTSPTGGAPMLATVQEWLDEAGVGRIGSVVGRYFAMDRDTRWDRTEKAVKLLMEGEAEHEAESGEAAARAAYERDETDEFITPTKVDDDAVIRPGDSVLAFNFRPDRMRQITEALTKAGVDRHTTLTEYEEGWPYPVAFPPVRPDVTLATVVSGRGETQLHVAETEKYPHVTYFFNGGEEEPYEGEVRELVDSPRDVPTYDKKPEMSAREAAEAFVRHWEDDSPVFGIINFANADMVGHTGVIEAAVKAVETVDECLGKVIEAVQASGGACIVTADHGNADEMLEEDGSPDTAHSLNPVPFLVTVEGASLDGEGILADVAPTVLALLGIDQPPEMTGRSLLAAD